MKRRDRDGETVADLRARRRRWRDVEPDECERGKICLEWQRALHERLRLDDDRQHRTHERTMQVDDAPVGETHPRTSVTAAT